MNFLYQLGVLLFDSFSRFFPFWRKNSFSFAKLQKICQSHFIFFTEKITIWADFEPANHDRNGIIDKTADDSNDRYSNDSFFKE